jgi:hypothetical protein
MFSQQTLVQGAPPQLHQRNYFHGRNDIRIKYELGKHKQKNILNNAKTKLETKNKCML